jgi:hypothetical protein
MVSRILRLALAAMLLLPPGFCPCHWFEEHAHAEAADPCQHADPQPDDDATPAPAEDEHQDDHNSPCPGHRDEPCSDCLARKLTESQFTNQTRAGVAKLIATPAFLSANFVNHLILAPASCCAFCLAPFPHDGTPIYLKLRALLL